MAMVATPVFINTMVVFVRLYWFERRFQHVVNEAQNLRRTRSRSRTKTEMLDQPDVEFKERGVDGRNIVVLHGGGIRKSDDATEKDSRTEDLVKDLESGMSSSSSSGVAAKSPETQNVARTPGLKRDITFVDDVKENAAIDSSTAPLRQRLNSEQHIAFLENQRNPKDKGILRIPGPRDFDRGDVPVQVDEDEEGEPLTAQVTSPSERKFSNAELPFKRNVTIEEPPHPPLRIDSATLSRRRASTAGTKPLSPVEEKTQLQTPLDRLRSRSGTFSSMRRNNTLEKDPMPYLSWQPTVGRNSAFVDLTEAQREELGGIEYRSLKTLALVLICKSGLRTGKNAYIDWCCSLLLLLPFTGCYCVPSLDLANRLLGLYSQK